MIAVVVCWMDRRRQKAVVVNDKRQNLALESGGEDKTSPRDRLERRLAFFASTR
jgi:hypothetical protein